MHSEHHLSLRWNDHPRALVAIFENLLLSGTLVDCIIAAEGQFLKAHKLVLSACSPYFRLLLSQQTENHPIIILKDIKFQELRALVDYIYRGEAEIYQDRLGEFLEAAESLQIKGLGEGNISGQSKKKASRDNNITANDYVRNQELTSTHTQKELLEGTGHGSNGGTRPLLGVISVPTDLPGVKTEPTEDLSTEMIEGEDKEEDEWKGDKEDGEHWGLQGTDNIQLFSPECMKTDHGSNAETRPLLDVIPVPADVPNVKTEPAEDLSMEMIEGEDKEDDEWEGDNDDDAADSWWQPEDNIQVPECVEEDPAHLMDVGRDPLSTASASPADGTVRRCSEVSINHVISYTRNGKEISINRTNHLQTDTAKKSFDVLKTSFSTDSFHKRIGDKNTGKAPHSCDICYKTFAYNSFLSNHMRTHTGEKPYCCDICKKTFGYSSHLSYHMRTHTGEKPYCCDVCKKTFAERKMLSIHMRTHTGEKPYSCDICKKTFAQRSTFSIHLRTHTGEKPYCCDICKKTFAKIWTFSNHMRSHTGERPYSCDLCKKTFARRSTFSIHMRTHTGEKPYCCEMCKKTFSQRSNLVTHVRTHI